MGYFPCSDCLCLVKSFENDSRGSGQELDTTRTTGGRERKRREREGGREERMVVQYRIAVRTLCHVYTCRSKKYWQI